jgi:hypothetical protein
VSSIQDRDGGIFLLATLFGMCPFLKKLFADGGYQGPEFQKALTRILPQLKTDIIKRSDQARCPGDHADARTGHRPDLCGHRTGNSASRLFVRRAHFGRIDEVKRIFSSAPTSPRSRTLARRTSTGPILVWIDAGHGHDARCGRGHPAISSPSTWR